MMAGLEILQGLGTEIIVKFTKWTKLIKVSCLSRGWLGGSALHLSNLGRLKPSEPHLPPPIICIIHMVWLAFNVLQLYILMKSWCALDI